MGRLVNTPYAHVSATLDKLDELGVTSEDFDNLRSGHNIETIEAVARLLRFHDPRCKKIIRGDKDPWQLGNHLRLVSHEKHPDFRIGHNPEFHGFEVYEISPHRKLDYEEFLEDIRKRNVLNANALDYLLANPTQIPFEWDMQGRETNTYVFAGTIYRTYGRLAVRGLAKRRGVWSETIVDLPLTRTIPNPKLPFLGSIVLGKEENFLSQ